MALDSESNPCCQKKGTLVITIEPCSKGKKTKPDRFYSTFDDRYIPGLPHKTPRTMEIEVKIKGKDQELFSEEESSPTPSVGGNNEEIELAIHSPSDEDGDKQRREKEKDKEEIESNKRDSSSESMKSAEETSKPKVTCSSKTIPLERKPCSETCPGPLICLQKKGHFFGDRCKLHDPTLIGKQILAMHKNGLIRKRLYISEMIYPDHILSAVSEISKRQANGSGGGKFEAVPEDNGDVVEEVVARRTIVPILSAIGAKEVEEAIVEPRKITPLAQAPKNDVLKKKGSGCFC